MGAPQADDQYWPTALARHLHALPHVNVTLHLVDPTFAPHSEIYLESLGILGSVPAAWLIFTLVVLLIYLLTRCCDRKPRRSISALKVTLAISAVLCCSAIGVGLYGNDDLHNGATQLLEQGRRVDAAISAIRNQTADIEMAYNRKMLPEQRELSDIFEGPVRNQSELKQLLLDFKTLVQENENAFKVAQDVRSPLRGISLARLLDLGERAEALRWPVTMGVLSALLVLCVVLLVGVARHSRCALIAFSVCGLLAVIASWLMASVYLASSVALADLCVAPDRFLASEAPPPLRPEILYYYTTCEASKPNPFTVPLRDAKTALERSRKALQRVRPVALRLFPAAQLEAKFSSLEQEGKAAERNFNGLTALVDCRALYKHYVHGARALCSTGLFGLALMLLSAALSGLLLTLLVWVDSHTWIYIKKRKDYEQVNDNDRYMPPSAPPSHAGNRTLRSQGSFADTMPPPYNEHDPLELQPIMEVQGGRDHAAYHHHHHQGQQAPSSQHQHHHQQHQHQLAHQQQQAAAQQQRHVRGHTLGRLPSHGDHHHHHHGLTGPNNGKYATLSKQCKTLESSDFY